MHVLSAIGMLGLMVPVLLEGHASLTGIGVTFTLFLWAAVAASRSRRRGLDARAPGGAVADPFAMGLMMAAHYLVLGLGGHGHGAVTQPSGPVAPTILGVFVLAAWAARSAHRTRGERSDRWGFWACAAMMLGMLISVSRHP